MAIQASHLPSGPSVKFHLSLAPAPSHTEGVFLRDATIPDRWPFAFTPLAATSWAPTPTRRQGWQDARPTAHPFRPLSCQLRHGPWSRYIHTTYLRRMAFVPSFYLRSYIPCSDTPLFRFLSPYRSRLGSLLTMHSFIHFVLAFASLFLAVNASFWMGDISHQGVAPYASSGYTVFRNVKDYGAAGMLTCWKIMLDLAS